MRKVSILAINILIIIGVVLLGCNGILTITSTRMPVTLEPSSIQIASTESDMYYLSTPDTFSSGDVAPEQQGCIPPLGIIAYQPLLVAGSVSKESPILPPSEWLPVADLPESATTIRKIIARSVDEIWVLLNPTGGDIWRYSVSKNEWTRFSNVNLRPVEFFDLVYTEQGELLAFGLDRGENNHNRVSGGLVIGRFDYGSNSFLLNEANYSALEAFNIATNVKADLNGTLWFMAQPKDSRFPDSLVAGKTLSLIRYDPSLGMISQRTEFSWPGKFDVAPDGSIWLLAVDSHTSKRHLVKYLPETNQKIDYWEFPPDYLENEKASHLNNLYFDHSDRLWIGDQGWVDFQNPNNPVWYQLIQPPVFLTNQSGQTAGGENQFLLTTWAVYDQIFQSRNGLYWFGSNYGLVRLTPQTGEWCKFTNGSSPIAEDAQGNLWIALFGKLYKHNLQQE